MGLAMDLAEPARFGADAERPFQDLRHFERIVQRPVGECLAPVIVEDRPVERWGCDPLAAANKGEGHQNAGSSSSNAQLRVAAAELTL